MGIMRTKKKKNHLNEFLGQAVNVITKLHTTETQQEDTTMISVQTPLVFAGIFLDYDVNNYYLSDGDGELKQIILREETVAIQLDPSTDTESVEEMLAKNGELN
jgi:uncharacterized membrane-anchored protein